MSYSESPLDDEVRVEIQGMLQGAKDAIEDYRDGMSPDEVQALLLEYIDGFREGLAEGAHEEETIVNTAIGFGCLWAQTLCDQLNWEWVSVSDGEHTSQAVVSPKRRFMVLPIEYMHKLVGSDESDQTSMLVYNMIKAGEESLPPSDEGSYTPLS